MALGLSPTPPQRQAHFAIPQDRPVYRAKSAQYLDDELYPEGTVFSWPDEPNLEMEPMNEMATENYMSYIKKLDLLGKKVAEKNGTSYQSYEDAHQNAIVMAQEEGRRVNVIGEKKQVTLMGAKKKSRAAKVDLNSDAPLMGNAKGKHAIGREAVNKSNQGLI